MFCWLKAVFSVERKLEVNALSEQAPNSLSFDEWARIERGEATEAEILAVRMPEPTQAPTQAPSQEEIVKSTQNNTIDEESKRNLVTLFTVLILVALFLVFRDEGSSSSSSQSSGFITGEKRTILGDGRLGCKVQSDIENHQKYLKQGDSIAAEKLGITGILSGQCLVFKNFDEVIIQEYAVWSGLVRVRKTGDIAEYWVSTSAIRPKL